MELVNILEPKKVVYQTASEALSGAVPGSMSKPKTKIDIDYIEIMEPPPKVFREYLKTRIDKLNDIKQ